MDDNNGNIVYYLILGAIYILSRVFGKKKKQNIPAPTKKRPVAAPSMDNDEEPPLTFEEILKELSAKKEPKPKPTPSPVQPSSQYNPVPQYVPIPTPAMEHRNRPEPTKRVTSLEEVGPSYSDDDMDKIAVDYDVPDPIGYGKLPEPDAMVTKRRAVLFERAKGFKIEKKETINYLEGLDGKDGAAKAFVMSEIFTRKYQ